MSGAVAAVRRALLARGFEETSSERVVTEALAVVRRAHAQRPATWATDESFLEHVLRASPETTVEAVALGLQQMQAGDLYLAYACASGVAEALRVVEDEHLSRVREFVASVDASPSFVAELTQQLRARLFAGDAVDPPRILRYSGRGSLGAWIRVTAVRLALDQARAAGSERRAQRALEPERVDPELGYLKDAYGSVVNAALGDALADLGAEARGLLKMHYVDGVSIEHVGRAFGVSRATAARRLAAAREELLEKVRARLAVALGAEPEEADSLFALVRSRLELSLARALGAVA